jgi:hypothetical protein
MTTTEPPTALVTRAPERLGLKIAEVMIQGNLRDLSADEKVRYYLKVCESLGLNPYTKPFDYLTLQGREILYARKDCTDQLRDQKRVSITRLEREQIGELYVVTAYAQRGDRLDSEVGAVNIANLKGEALANAMMKAVTKAKRRVTLSICGLGFLDESEIESVPDVQTTEDREVTKRLAAQYDRSIGAQEEAAFVPTRERDVDDRQPAEQEVF